MQIADFVWDRKRIEAQITEIGNKQENKKMEIVQLQTQLQQAAAAAEQE
jgi:hypothetical protein